MVTIKREGIILECTDLNFESESVMNPAVIPCSKRRELFNYWLLQAGRTIESGSTK